MRPMTTEEIDAEKRLRLARSRVFSPNPYVEKWAVKEITRCKEVLKPYWALRAAAQVYQAQARYMALYT